MTFFFSAACQESPRTDTRFGLRDDRPGQRAYTDVGNQDQWIATVQNDGRRAVTFTAIDNCVIINKPNTNNRESLCDGMLTFGDSLYLIELKVQAQGGGLATAKKQLENTIRRMSAMHDLSAFRYKKAFVCNKKHPKFQIVVHEEQRRLYQTTGFRFDVQATINIP